jgi:hypothetical protein
MLAVSRESLFSRSSLPLVRPRDTRLPSPSPKRASGGQGADAVAGHSCAECRHGVLRPPTKTGSISFRGHAGKPGAMTHRDHAPGGVRARHAASDDGLGADGAVPKAVVDEGDDLSRHGDPGDLAATDAVAVMSGDAEKVGPQLGPVSPGVVPLRPLPISRGGILVW